MIALAKEIIAVVEDDDGMRKALERLLRIAGFQPLLFTTAEAFLGDQAGDFYEIGSMPRSRAMRASSAADGA